MPRLIIKNDQLNATGKEVIPFHDGVTATEMLMQIFPDGIDREKTTVFIGVSRMTLPDNGLLGSPDLFEPLTTETVTVFNEVKGWEVYLIYAIVAAVAVIALTPTVPGNAGTTKTSPNNTLQAQTNTARPYQAYPLVLGSPILYPDLTSEALVEYDSNIKYVTQLMCIGVGMFDVEEIRAGETPLTNFVGSTATYFEPVNKNTLITEVINPFQSNEVDGQELLPAGEGVTINSYEFEEYGSSGDITYIGNQFTFKIEQDGYSDQLKADFDAAVIDFILRIEYRITVTGSSVTNEYGSGIVESVTLDGTDGFYTVVINDFNGDTGEIYSFYSPIIAENQIDSVVGPINMQVETDEIWFNFSFPRGLKSTAKIDILMIQLDGKNGDPIIGPGQQYPIEYEENTLEAQFKTFKLTGLSKSWWSFEITRSDLGTNNSNKPDSMQVESVYSILRESNVSYGNLSFVKVFMPATVNATSLRENKINLTATAKMITYENSAINYTPQASQKFADALLYMYVDFFGLDPATLDLEDLYEIQNRLDAIDPQLATFDFTFDDIDVSLDERMDAILQVARCYKWLDGDVYRFGRDDAREFETTLITRRDIASPDEREYSLTYNAQLLETYDSVKVQYVDPDTNTNAYIYRKIDGLGNVIDDVGENPKSMELSGCRNETNAINRAELEMRKLIYQRFSLSDTLLSGGNLLNKGDMVLYAEQYNNSEVFDGEILAIDGNIATTSESIQFQDGVSYYVQYTVEDGSQIGPFLIVEVEESEFMFECDGLLSAYVRDSELGYEVQTGSRYMISTTSELEAARWTVFEKEVTGDNVQINMINYDNRIYEFDS